MNAWACGVVAGRPRADTLAGGLQAILVRRSLQQTTPAENLMVHIARGFKYMAAALLLGCSPADIQPQIPRLPLAGAQQPPEETLVACISGDTALFPSAELRKREGWYGKHLRAAGEEGLCRLGAGAEVYRFTWLRTWHGTVVVRVERRGDQVTLHARQLDGAGGYEPGQLVVNRSIQLGAGEWERLRVLLDSAAFWSPATPTEQPTDGLDGARWVLEGTRGNRYRAVDRWSPDETGPDRHIRAVGLYLLHLARLMPSDPEDVY